MKSNRRDFVKTIGISSLGILAAKTGVANVTSRNNTGKGSRLKLRFRPYDLQLTHTFTVASYSRNTTPVVLTELEYDGIIGYGEASLPPYLGESHQSVITFLNKLDMEQFTDPFRMDEILEYVNGVDIENRAAKASVDIALHDLIGKIINQPLYKLWGLTPENTHVRPRGAWLTTTQECECILLPSPAQTFRRGSHRPY
jgi:hypothetical protein